MCRQCDLRAISAERSFSTTTRRRFLGGLATLPAMGLAATSLPAAAAEPPRPQNVMTPDAALERLREGNDRYRNNQSRKNDFAAARAALTSGQNPFAAVLSCADSRVSPEFCFDEERGDLFVTRVAGNYLTPDLLASLEFGAAVLGTPLIMVLGHTSCGAISAAIDAEQNGTDYPGHIQTITTAIAPAVRDVLAADPKTDDMLDAVTRANIRRNVAMLQDATPVLRGRVAAGQLKVVGGLYHLDTGEVEVL